MSCQGADSLSNECLASCEWAGCLLGLFRAHVGDFTDPPTWSDSRALDILVASAFQVSQEVNCISVPSLNFCTQEFTSNPFHYPKFIALWMLKAACIVDQGALRTRALQEGLRASCGPALLEVKGGGQSVYKVLFEEGPCKAYKDLLENLCFRSPIQTGEHCTQVVGTFVSTYYKEGCRGSCSYYR